MNINSDNINIYPVSKRTSGNQSGAVISQYGYIGNRNFEINITNQYNTINDLKNYSRINIDVYDNNLIISSGKICMNGYIFTLTKSINIPLANYPHGSNTSFYWISFKIQLKQKEIIYPHDNTVVLSTYELDGEDINSKYTGFSVDISKEYPASTNSTDMKSIVFIVGLLSYSKIAGWKFVPVETSKSNISIGNMQITVNNEGISEIPISTDMSDWLDKYFILDDGEIE